MHTYSDFSQTQTNSDFKEKKKTLVCVKKPKVSIKDKYSRNHQYAFSTKLSISYQPYK